MQPSWKHTNIFIYSLLLNILCLNFFSFFFFFSQIVWKQAGVAACCSSCLHRKLILWYYLTHYHRYKQFLTWNMITLFWCRFWPGNLTRYGKKIVFIWVPSHVGIRGNLAADSAAKDAIIGDISVELIPFSDLKSHANKYILELWQSESDEFLEN